MRYMLFMAVILAFLATGCSNSSKNITDHFIHLTEIAETNKNDCENMARSLNQYLEKNKDAIRSAVSNVSQATPDEASGIYEASAKLHIATEHCHNPEFEAFKTQLSELVLREAVDD